jgi:anti-sigma factor RsiW
MSDQNFLNNANISHPQEDHQDHRRMIEPLISLYQDGEASKSERQLVEQYLATCDECNALYSSFQQIDAGLRAYFTAIPEPRLKPEAYAFLHRPKHPARVASAEGQLSLHATNKGQPRFRAQPLYTLAGALTALLVIIFLTVYLALPRQSAPGNLETAPVAGGSGYSTPTTAVITSTSQPGYTAIPGVESTSGPKTTEPLSVATQAVTTSSVVFNTPLPASTGSAQGVSTKGSDTIGSAGQGVVSKGNESTVSTSTAVQKTVPPRVSSLPTPTNLPVATIPVQGGSVPTNTALPEPPVTPTITQNVVPTPKGTDVPTVVPTPTPTEPPTASPESAPSTAASVVLPNTSTPTSSAGTTGGGQVYSTSPGWIAYVDRTDKQLHFVQGDGSNDEVVGDPQIANTITWDQLIWSNDARWLAAVGISSETGSFGIYLIDSQNLHSIQYVTEGIAPVWSPDSRSLTYLAAPISFNGKVKQGRPSLYNLSKRQAVTISTQPDSLTPQWFDDGKRLLVGQDQVYSLDAGQTTPFKLPFLNECVGNSLSPSGNKLAVLEQGASGKFETVIYDLSKGRIDPKTPLLRVAAPVQGAIGKICGSQRLSWTPDSKYVYYYTSNNPSFSTCMVRATDGTATCLSNVYEPSFTSDGSNLVDYSPSSTIGGLVYSMPTALGGRPPNLRTIAETRIPPVWQPK